MFRDSSHAPAKIRMSGADRLLLAFLTSLAGVFFLIFVFPVVYVIFSSLFLTDTTSAVNVRFSTAGYVGLLENPMVFQGFQNSVLYTAVGTCLSVFVTVVTAYVLSKPDFQLRGAVTFLFVFTNYFSGGFIPTYLLLKDLHLLNTMWALILPSSISVYNLFLLTSYFRNKVPSELYDAASMDGCGHGRYLLWILLPLARSYVGVIAFFYGVSYWNAYFNASIFITDMDKLPLPNIIHELLLRNQGMLTSQVPAAADVTPYQQARLMEYALIVVACVPMVALFLVIRRTLKDGDWFGGIKL